jgi:hypothetical protein
MYTAYPTETNLTTRNNLSNSSDWVGDTLSNNRYQTVNQFTNSAAGDYTLTANSTGTNQGATRKRAVNYGTPIAGITDGYVGSAPDAGAFEQGVTAWTAGATWKAWTAGNQVSAPLTSTLYVRSDSVRNNTSPLSVGRSSTIDSTLNRRSFVKFDLSGLSDVSGSISNAVLRLYECSAPESGTGSVDLYKVTSPWTDADVSYDQSVGASISGWYDPANFNLYTDIDITQWVQGWLNDPSTNYGLSLRSTAESADGSAKLFDGLYGIYNGVTGPQLVITTIPEPGTLVMLAAALLGLACYAWRKRK